MDYNITVNEHFYVVMQLLFNCKSSNDLIFLILLAVVIETNKIITFVLFSLI